MVEGRRERRIGNIVMVTRLDDRATTGCKFGEICQRVVELFVGSRRDDVVFERKCH